MSLKHLAALLCAATLLAPAPAGAVTFQGLQSLGFQQMTSLGSATALPAIPPGTQEAFIICTGQTVYWRDDGVAPTATVGMPLPINTPFPYTGSIASIKLIQTSASATCNVTYFGS